MSIPESTSAFVVNLPDMIEMALGTTNINFKVLKCLLHVMVKQFSSSGIAIQFTDKSLKELAKKTIKRCTNIIEYTVEDYNHEKPFDLNTLNLTKKESDDTSSTNDAIIKTLIVFDDPLKNDAVYPQHQQENETVADVITKTLPESPKLIDTIKHKDSNVLINMIDMLNVTKRIEATEVAIEKLTTIICDIGMKKSTEIESIKNTFEKLNVNRLETAPNNSSLSNDYTKYTEHINTFGQQLADISKFTKHNAIALKNIDKKLNLLERNLINLTEKNAEIYSDIRILEKEICKIQNEFIETVEKVDSLIDCCEANAFKLTDLSIKIVKLTDDIEKINKQVKNLQDERAARKHQIDILIEQIEQIKCIKSNQEEMEKCFNEKADKIDVYKKVSYTNFDAITKDLSQGLLDALEKIIENDKQWHRICDEIYKFLETKVDRTEATIVRERILNTLNGLQEKFQSLSSIRFSCESTGVSKQYIKDVKCMLCNADTFIDPTIKFPLVPLTKRLANDGGHSKRYKFHKNGQNKWQRRCFNRKVYAADNSTVVVRDGIQKPIFEHRYCGGNHTKIEATERLVRKGNFLTQFNNAIPKTNMVDHFMTGTDGNLYKVGPDCKCND